MKCKLGLGVQKNTRGQLVKNECSVITVRLYTSHRIYSFTCLIEDWENKYLGIGVEGHVSGRSVFWSEARARISEEICRCQAKGT
jgi:hypothetical protein